jgi:alpha-L-glutamate ligase-like protein
MFWLFSPLRLARLGILAMNRRNAACILDHNPRRLFPLVDDKLRMRDLCRRINVPTPEIFAVIERHSQLRRLSQLLAGPSDFVLKPNRGSAGRGVLVVIGRDRDRFLRHNGERLDLDDLRQHVSDILSGMYSLGGRPDEALVQYRVQLHPAFAPIAFKGIPDLRVIVYRGEPAMAMLRLPTRESSGRANLHQGGIGAGVELDTGRTHHAVRHNRFVHAHPDTNVSVVGREVPCWGDVLAMSRRAALEVGLGYVGIDIVIDATHGPMLLEANARPGLAIQIANARGLRPRLDSIDAEIKLRELWQREEALKVTMSAAGCA